MARFFPKLPNIIQIFRIIKLLDPPSIITNEITNVTIFRNQPQKKLNPETVFKASDL